jgi:hypothetical protein
MQNNVMYTSERQRRVVARVEDYPFRSISLSAWEMIEKEQLQSVDLAFYA